MDTSIRLNDPQFKWLELGFLLFAITFIFSCGSSRKKEVALAYDVVTMQDRLFPRSDSMGGQAAFPFLFADTGDTLLGFYDFTSEEALLYDWNSRLGLQRLKLTPQLFATENRKPTRVNVHYLHWLNKRQWVAALNPIYLNNGLRMDDCMFKYTVESVPAVAYFTMDSFPGPTTKNPFFPRTQTLGLAFPRSNVIDRERMRWIVTTRPWMDFVPGDSVFEQGTFRLVGTFDLTQPNLAIRFLPLQNPRVPTTRYFPKSFTSPSVCIGSNGSWVFSYAYSDQVFLYHPEAAALDTYSMPSSLIDTVRPLAKPTSSSAPANYPMDDLSLPAHKLILYDPYRYQYIKLCRIPMGPYGGSNQLPAYSLILADTAFRVIGEALLPDELVPPYDRFALFPAPDGLYCWNPARTSAYDDRYVFTRLDFKPTRKPAAKTLRRHLAQQAAASKPQGRGLPDYLRRNHQLTLENEAVLLVPVDNSCASCKDFVLRYYADSVLATGATGPRLLLLAADATAIEQAIATHGLAPYRERILTDPRRLALRYVPEWINPRWVVVRGGQLATDAVLNPTEIYTLPNRVRRWRMGE